MSTTNTITMNTSDLHDITLNWAVAKCEGHNQDERWLEIFMYQSSRKTGYNYATNWAIAGRIIEDEWINLTNSDDVWRAEIATDVIDGYLTQYGQSPLEAAMRVYVELKLGDTVEVPAVVFEAMGVSA